MEITSYFDPVKITKAIYTDAASGVTHIIHCNSSNGVLYYTRLDDTGLFITGPTELVSNSRCYHIEISGPHDGQRVFIAMEARRTMNTDECSMSDLGSCDDIYVIESPDGGMSWKEPKNVGGYPGDPIRRRGFKLLTNWKSKFFWLLYAKYEGKASSVVSVKYEYEKGIFYPEKLVLNKFASLSNYQVSTFDDNGKTTLQFIYSTPLTLTLQNKISTDDGETWTQAEGLKTICDSGKYVLRNLISAGKYLVAGCVKNDFTFFTFSDNNGKTWTAPNKFPSKDIEDLSFCGKEDPLSPTPIMMILFREKRNMTLSYAQITNTNPKFVDVPDAFYYGAAKMDLTCSFKGGEFKIRFMYHIRHTVEGRSKYTLNIIDNDNAEESSNKPEKVDL
jgi:hypothetical protein